METMEKLSRKEQYELLRQELGKTLSDQQFAQAVRELDEEKE